MTTDDADAFEIWPENWPTWKLWAEMSSQWRVAGMGGLIGLDYAPLFMRMDRMRLDEDTYELMFADIRAMESAVLEIEG